LNKNHRFNLKCKIKNNKKLGHRCLILFLILKILLFSLLLIMFLKNIITIEKNHKFIKNIINKLKKYCYYSKTTIDFI